MRGEEKSLDTLLSAVPVFLSIKPPLCVLITSPLPSSSSPPSLPPFLLLSSLLNLFSSLLPPPSLLPAVLVLYLNRQLNFNEDSATAIYHAFIMLCYLLPLLGAIISDSCLGKYLTILSLSIIYAVGNIVVSVSALPFNLHMGM